MGSGFAVDVLVVGGGMYVTGRGAEGSRGTIGPALLEGRRSGAVGRIAVAATSAESARDAADRLRRLARDMAVDDGDIVAFPAEGRDEAAYLAATGSFRPHAAVVSVPDDTHREVCVALAERGIHLLCVKPMAGTRADAVAMARAAEAAGIVAQVEFHKRLDESNLVLRESVAGGTVGTPLYAVIEYSQRKTIPRDVFRAWVARTNIFQYLGVHYVDLLLWATGFTPLSVSAWGQKDHLTSLGLDTWDAMQVVIEWGRPDGGRFVSTHITNWIDPDSSSAMSDQKINLVGTGGRCQCDQKHRGIQLVVDGRPTADVNPYFTASWHDPALGGLVFGGYGIRSVLQFVGDVAAVRGGRTTAAALAPHRPDFRQGVISTAVVEAASESLARGGCPVAVITEE